MIFDDTGYHRLQGILCYLWKVWKSIWLWKMWICACNSCFTVDTVCMCVCRGSKWFQQLDKLLWNGKWKTEPKHRMYLHYRTGGWQFDNDNDATFSIELTYYYHSHFVSSIMSLFKFHEMLTIFDTVFCSTFIIIPPHYLQTDTHSRSPPPPIAIRRLDIGFVRISLCSA